MPEPAASEPQPNEAGWYSYAIIRLVPRVERAEFMNVGVVLFARQAHYLQADIELDELRALALWPAIDLADVRRHCEVFSAIAAGRSEGGPIGAFPPSERFHWLTAPRSTVLQPSPVHVGCCDDPAVAMEGLLDEFVRPPKG